MGSFLGNYKTWPKLQDDNASLEAIFSTHQHLLSLALGGNISKIILIYTTFFKDFLVSKPVSHSNEFPYFALIKFSLPSADETPRYVCIYICIYCTLWHISPQIIKQQKEEHFSLAPKLYRVIITTRTTLTNFKIQLDNTHNNWVRSCYDTDLQVLGKETGGKSRVW